MSKMRIKNLTPDQLRALADRIEREGSYTGPIQQATLKCDLYTLLPRASIAQIIQFEFPEFFDYGYLLTEENKQKLIDRLFYKAIDKGREFRSIEYKGKTLWSDGHREINDVDQEWAERLLENFAIIEGEEG